MLNSTSALLSMLLGEVFPAWISCEPVQILLGMVVLGIVLKYVIRLFHL